METAIPTAATPRTRGRPFKRGECPNPNGSAAPRVRADTLFNAMATELAPLSAVDEVLLRAASQLLARAERTLDPDARVRMNSEARRTIQGLRRGAAAKAPAPGLTLAQYLKIHHSGGDQAAEAAPVTQDSLSGVSATHTAANTETLASESLNATVAPSDDGEGAE
jgi:hypothetical protein